MFHCVYVLRSKSLFLCSTISTLHCVYVPMYLYSIATVFHVCVLHCARVLHVYTPPCLSAVAGVLQDAGLPPPPPPPGSGLATDGSTATWTLGGPLSASSRRAAWLGLTSCLSCLTLRHRYPALCLCYTVIHCVCVPLSALSFVFHRVYVLLSVFSCVCVLLSVFH